MKNYYLYQEYPHYDMKQNFDNYNFEEININQNCHIPRPPKPCGCRPICPPQPMPYPPRPMPNLFCDNSILLLLSGIVIGKILD